MKFSLKSILAALVIGVSVTACNFGDATDTTTNTVTYEATDLLMRLDAGGNVTTPEPPKLQIKLTTSGASSNMAITFTNLRLESGNITFTTPEMPVKVTENGGLEVKQAFVTPSGASTMLESFVFQVNGNWINISMIADNEVVNICSSWIWTGSQLYNAGYEFNDMKNNVSLFGGDTYVRNPVTGTSLENKNIEYGFVFDTKKNTVNIYSFFTSLTDTQSATKTYLFENIPYTLDASGILFSSNDSFAAKVVTKYDTEGKEDPEMTVSHISGFIPYSGLNGNFQYVVTDDNVTVSCNSLKLVNQLVLH